MFRVVLIAVFLAFLVQFVWDIFRPSGDDFSAMIATHGNAKALAHLKTKAEHGYGAAQGQLGDLYYHGAGVKQDYAEAYFWYSLAAKNNEHAAARTGTSLQEAATHLTPEQKAVLDKRIAEWKSSATIGERLEMFCYNL